MTVTAVEAVERSRILNKNSWTVPARRAIRVAVVVTLVWAWSHSAASHHVVLFARMHG